MKNTLLQNEMKNIQKNSNIAGRKSIQRSDSNNNLPFYHSQRSVMGANMVHHENQPIFNNSPLGNLKHIGTSEFQLLNNGSNLEQLKFKNRMNRLLENNKNTSLSRNKRSNMRDMPYPPRPY